MSVGDEAANWLEGHTLGSDLAKDFEALILRLGEIVKDVIALGEDPRPGVEAFAEMLRIAADALDPPND